MTASSVLVACVILCLAASSIAEESEPAGGPELDEYTKKEVAQRAALDALLKSEPISVVGLTKEIGFRKPFIPRGI